MNFLFFILVIFCCSGAYSYNGTKCWEKYMGNGSPGGRVIGTSSSTTSYISSTGDCAAFGYHSKKNKEMYFAQNNNELQLDIAKGHGPYLSELNSIYGCSDIAHISNTLMSKYEFIYSSKRPKQSIEMILKNKNCKYI